MCVRVCRPLTALPDVEAEGGLQLADVVADGDVQAVDACRGEGVIQSQRVLIQHRQRAASGLVRLAVGHEAPAQPHGRAETHTHTPLFRLRFFLFGERKMTSKEKGTNKAGAAYLPST